MVRILRLLRQQNPSVMFVLENVYGMRDADRDTITRTLGVSPLRLRASYITACRRDRYFWTNLPPCHLRKPKAAKNARLQRSYESFNDVLVSGQREAGEVARLSEPTKASCITKTWHMQWNLVQVRHACPRAPAQPTLHHSI